MNGLGPLQPRGAFSAFRSPRATMLRLHGRRALSSEYRDAGLNVYVTSDNSDVYEDRFRKIACGESDCIQPTLISLGVRLGIDRVTPVYWKSLTDLLKYPQSVGIAGYVPVLQPYQRNLWNS